MLVPHIRTGNTLFRSKGRHGVGTGQIHRNQFFGTAEIRFLDVMFLLFYRNTSPVAHLFISPGQSFVHGGLAGVRVAGQGNSHKQFLLFSSTLTI